MPTIYIAGTSSGTGTTAVATGIAALLAKSDAGVTLAKAVRVGSSAETDADPTFYQTLLPHNEPPSDWPITLDDISDASALDGVAARLKAANLSAGLTIVEGVGGDMPDGDRHRIDATLAKALDARVILVGTYTSAESSQLAKAVGDQLMGVIINRVPDHSRHDAETTLTSSYQEQGISVLGLLPESRRMLAPTVGEVAEHLGADLINRTALTSPETQLGQLVEYFMLGGLFLDQGGYVFGRRENKAVIVRGDRPDLQMAALDTSTACLILTGGKTPVQYIAHHAQLRQTPMLATPSSTLDTMELLHSIGDKASVHSPHKAQCFADLLEAHCDLGSLTAQAAT